MKIKENERDKVCVCVYVCVCVCRWMSKSEEVKKQRGLKREKERCDI